MAKDNLGDSGSSAGSNNSVSSTPSSSRGAAARSKPYDANNSFVKKVATKMTDLIPQRSWISKWFNNSQGEAEMQSMETDNSEFKGFEEKESLPPPLKRPCIRMDVVHPPGTFAIKPRNRNIVNESDTSKDPFSNHNETTQDFLEPTSSRPRVHRFVASTPAFPVDTNKVFDILPTLNMLMSEQNNGAANGIDDNSESSESTSGCSSLIPQNNRQQAPSNANYNSPLGSKRRFIDDKLNFTNHLQSPRSLFLDSTTRETLGSRRPSFNPLMMNSNNSTLQRSSSLSSPFYPGNTTFGGANAANLYRSSSVLSEPSYQAPKRTSVQVNPSSESSKNDRSGMSQTAQRILEALDQFSSPLSDARKIPVRNIMDGRNQSSLSSPQLTRKRAREEETGSPKVGLRHLTRELMVPTVPDMLRIRRREKLQNTTLNARKIMTARNATASAAPQEYHIRTEVDPEPKRSTQLKAKKKTNLEEEATVEAVNLPTAPLRISSLPRFDISLPQCTKPATSENKQQELPQRQQTKADKETVRDFFKFASPIKLSDGAKNLESINNFTFSKPMSPTKLNSTLSLNESNELSKTLSIDSNDSMTGLPSFPNFIWSGPTSTLKAKEKAKEEIPKELKVANELKQGSVMDFFTKKPVSDDFSNVWECNECLIKNNGKETHCVACKSAKPETSKAESVKSDSSDDIEIIECPSSMQESKSSKQSWGNLNSTKSISSLNSSPSIFGKPNATSFQSPSTASSVFNCTNTNVFNEKSKSDTSIITSKPSAIPKSNSEPTAASSLAFKPAKSSWECPCCMVHNLETVTTCPCCNTAKPGSVNVSPKRTEESTVTSTATITSGFGDKFKKPEGAWSCDACLVQNKAEINKCVACETPRAGAAKSSTSTLSTTSISTLSSSGFGDKFKKPEGSWTCDSCMLSNKAEATKCIACETAKPGGSEVTKSTSKLQFNVDMPANAGSFKFGIDKAEDSAKVTAAAALSKTNGFSFGSSSTTQPTGGGFSFGIPNTDAKKDTDVVEASTSEGFAFKPNVPVTATATFQFGAKSATETKDKEEKKPASTATFSFGAPSKTDAEKPANTKFVFGKSMSIDATTEKKPEEKSETKPLTASFSFGAQSAATATVTKDSMSDNEIKPASEASPANNFLFGSPKPAFSLQPADATEKDDEKKPEAPKVEIPKAVPTFGAPATEQPKPAFPTFSFGTPSTTNSASASAPSSSLFMFSGQPKPAGNAVSSAAPLPCFGSPAAPKPIFSFGKPAETTTSATATPQEQQSTENKTTTLTFGSAATSPSFGSQTNQTTPSLFGSINATPSPASTLGTSENKPLLFGASENKIAPAFGEPQSKIPAFSTSTATSAPATNVFPSATPSSTAPAPLSFGSTFGSGAPSTFGSNATPGIFTTKPAETTPANPGLFSFGQSSQPTTPATGGFNFNAGSNATTTNEQKSLFTFGGSSNTQVGNGFGSGSFSSVPTAAPPAATPSFGFNAAPKPEVASVASFGQVAPATTPMFNAPNPVGQTAAQPPAYPGTAPALAMGGFNFGSTNVPSSFNFGSSSTPSSGGYNFNAPSTAAAPVAFDPNAQPTFNFTAGSGAPTTFNAPPARRIKKAVRRMTPRQ